jgi:hypothetical protein
MGKAVKVAACGSDGWILVTYLRLEASRPEILAEADVGVDSRQFDQSRG